MPSTLVYEGKIAMYKVFGDILRRKEGSLGADMVLRRGSTQREALATQREKNIPHVPLINNFFFSKGKIKSSICFGKLPM